jgi:hypothetical protein
VLNCMGDEGQVVTGTSHQAAVAVFGDFEPCLGRCRHSNQIAALATIHDRARG